MNKFDPTFKSRPLSYSQLSCFHYADRNKFGPEEWYKRYILGEKELPSKELIFGSFIDKKIQNDPEFLIDVPRYKLMQHKMTVIYDGIHLTGLPDGLDLDKRLLADYKTGRHPWTQKRADETDQITMYLLLVYITKKISPEKFRCFIHWLPTVEAGDFSVQFKDDPCIPETFETKRTMRDILAFIRHIRTIVKAMKEYVEAHE